MAVAPDIATLYAYESEILPAWVAVLVNRGLNAFIEFSDETKETPFVDVFLDHVVPQTQQHFHTDQRLYWCAWTGWIIHKVFTQRGLNSSFQASYLKEIRSAAFDFTDVLDEAALPYHDFMTIKESPHGSGLRQGVDHQLNLDWSELPLEVQFSVRTDAWPG